MECQVRVCFTLFKCSFGVGNFPPEMPQQFRFRICFLDTWGKCFKIWISTFPNHKREASKGATPLRCMLKNRKLVETVLLISDSQGVLQNKNDCPIPCSKFLPSDRLLVQKSVEANKKTWNNLRMLQHIPGTYPDSNKQLFMVWKILCILG